MLKTHIAAKANPYFREAVQATYLASQGIAFPVPVNSLKRRKGGLKQVQRCLSPGQNTRCELEKETLQKEALRLLEQALNGPNLSIPPTTSGK